MPLALPLLGGSTSFTVDTPDDIADAQLTWHFHVHQRHDLALASSE
jgi:hypothetical protein